MYAYTDLRAEIEQQIELERERNSDVLHPDWITTAVLKLHPDIRGQDADFFAYNAREHIRNEVRRQLNRYKLKPEGGDRQLILPGFECLQERYLVLRADQHVAVHIDCLSSEEANAKLFELNAMAAGVLKHVEEFRRYFRSKGIKLAA